MSERKEQGQQRHGSFTLTEWCEHRRISPGMFYKLAQQGLAPRTYYVGNRRHVSGEADAEWLRAREAESSAA
jgi:hypothetical protein